MHAVVHKAGGSAEPVALEHVPVSALPRLRRRHPPQAVLSPIPRPDGCAASPGVRPPVRGRGFATRRIGESIVGFEAQDRCEGCPFAWLWRSEKELTLEGVVDAVQSAMAAQLIVGRLEWRTTFVVDRVFVGTAGDRPRPRVLDEHVMPWAGRGTPPRPSPLPDPSTPTVSIRRSLLRG